MELLYCGEQNVCTEHDIDTNSNDNYYTRYARRRTISAVQTILSGNDDDDNDNLRR